MLGYVADIAFYNVPDQSGIVGLNWRLMLGSAALPPIAVMILVFMSPESPRWYLSKNRYEDAYTAMLRLRKTPLRAARDTYAAYEGVLAERALNASRSRNRLVEMVTTARIRKGVQSSGFVMFMQQFCGINVRLHRHTRCSSSHHDVDNDLYPLHRSTHITLPPSSSLPAQPRWLRWAHRWAGARSTG